MVHSENDYNKAIEASQILFGKATSESLAQLNEATFLDVFNGVPNFSITSNSINKGINIIDLLCGDTNVFSSKSELRRLMKDNGLSINKEKVQNTETIINQDFLIKEKYILIQKGKKKYFLIIVQ